MDRHSANARPRPKTSQSPKRRPILRSLLTITISLAFLGLALAVPIAIAANTNPAETTSPSISNTRTADARVHDQDRVAARDQGTAQPASEEPAAPISQPEAVQSNPFILLQTAGPDNGSFESGDLSNWVRAGSADNSEALESTDFSPNIDPTDGNWFALLCTGPGPVNGTPQGNIDGDLDGTQEFDTSILRQTFTLSNRDVPATLLFDWSFLTDEGTRAPDPFDDIFLVQLNGDQLLAGSRPGGDSPFQDVSLTEPGASVSSDGDTDGCSFSQGRTSFEEFSTLITEPGDYTLEFLVADQGDNDIDSGLLIDNVRLTPEVDLEITKTADPDPAVAGEPLTYEVTVENFGSGRARDVIVTDTLPIEVDYITDTLPSYVTVTLPSGCTFSPGTPDQLFCDLGDIVGGTSRSFEIHVAVDSDALVQALADGSRALINTAEVDAETPDINLENNIFTLETILQDRADLRVTKMSKPDTSVRAGDIFTYHIFVDNLGPSAARNVVLTDTILSSGAFELVTPESDIHDPDRSLDSCSVTATSGGSVVTCELGEPLEPQGEAPRNGRWAIQMQVRANQAQDVNNEVRAFSIDPDGPAGEQLATPDPDTSNNRATDFISVTAVADLGMTKIGLDAGSDPDGNPFTVLAGERVTWTVEIANNGPSTAENVAIVDILSGALVKSSINVIAVTPPVGGGQCNVGTPGDPNDPLICQVGNLEPGDTAIMTLTADIDPSYVATQPNTDLANLLPNNAFLTSDTFDPDTDDNIVFDAFLEVFAQADLGVQKMDRPDDPPPAGNDPAIAGRQLEYTLTISNAGPSTAEDTVLLDELPDALTAIEVNVVNEPDAICSIRTTPANRIDCGFGNILPGKTITLVITSLIDPSTPAGTITNTATLTSVTPDPDPDPTPNQVQQETQVETQADVEIRKIGEPVKVPAGEQVKYTLWVENNGPSDAQDVTVFDLLPDEVVYEIDTNSPICTRPGTQVGRRAVLTDTLGNETEAAGLATFVLITDTNTVQFAVEVTDIDNITGTILTDGSTTIPLYSGPPPPFDPTNPIVGSIVNASLVSELRDNPENFDVIVQTSDFPSGEISGQVEEAITTMTDEPNVPLHCQIGTLPAGETHQFVIWALVDPATPAGTIITNVGIVTSTTTLGDPVPGNNVASANNFVEGEADLHLRKFGKPDGEVRADEILTYTVIADNLGPSAAEGVAIKDVLQSAGTYDLVDISSDRDTTCIILPPGGVTQTETIPGTPWPPTAPVDPPLVPDISERVEIDCTLDDGLEVLDADGPPNSGRWLLTVRVRGQDSSQNINNVASVLSEQDDPNLDNNNAFVLHDIIDVADMSVTQTAEGQVQDDPGPGGDFTLQPDQVTAGMDLTYTLTITNNGPSTAENVVIQDRLPPGIVIVPDTVTVLPEGSCSTGTPGEPLDKLTCGLDTMAPDDVATVTIHAHVNESLPPGTILENDVFVFSDLFDDNNANNYSHNLTAVNAFADLIVTKTDNPDPVVAGELLEYTVTVTNTGPSDAIDVVVVDVLPAEVEFLRIRDPFAIGVTCSLNPIDERTLTCSIGDMPDGDVKTFTILTRVDPAAPAQLDNLVTVSSDTADPDAPNEFEEPTGVDREQQLFVQKNDSPDPVLAGTELRYTITFGNNGPSQAENVIVTDTLPLGVIFDHCESLDPNDQVTCKLISGDGDTVNEVVRVESILDGNTEVFSNTGTLDVGESFTFLLIANVESGYILDGRGDTSATEPRICNPFFDATGYPYFAHNRADISADLLEGDVVVGQATDRDDECTRVEAEADLELTKTDDTGGFQVGDPVSPGGIITYTLHVTNTGPSDAAQVVLEDQLPPEGLALDPNTVKVWVDGELLTDCLDPDDPCFVRDDGLIRLVVGDDPNNDGEEELGRINAGNGATIMIQVIVTLDATCDSELTNTALVETQRNDKIWPPKTGAAFAPTPTEDPDTSNNKASEDTRIVCPDITIDKTVSLNGTCPGTNNVAIGFLGEPVTYCYEVTNTGETYLDFVTITDTIRTRSGPHVIFEETFRFDPDGDPNVPLSPGASFITQTTVPDTGAFIDCNDRPDTAVVTAVSVNRGRTLFASVPIASDSDDALVETPCKGVDWRLQLPALNTTECDTWIQVQNVGNEVTKGLLVLWGEPGFCPPQSYGPLKVECTGLLREGSAWSFSNPYLPAGARSAIMYSLNATDIVTDERGNERLFADMVCNRLFPLMRQNHDEWLLFDRAYREQGTYFGPLGDFPEEQLVVDFGAHQGEPLAVTVNRTCPDPIDPNLESSASYVGISTDREGIRDPRAGGFAYYAPLVYADFFGMNSIIHIQNSGNECTSIELWFQQQGDCIHPVVWDILQLAPGESIAFDPNTVVGPQWQGSVWISASQPLGIVVDTLGANHFGSYHGVPADVHIDGGSGDFSLGTQVNYAPLIYREHQGWETVIQVQNLSSIHNAKVKVSFLDNSGNVVKTVIDWICPRGSGTFYLPVIAGLPGNWVGAARIESQDWLSPGDPAIDSSRILSVVMLEKYTDPAKTARQEAVVYNALQEMGSFDWQLGPGETTGFGGSDVLSVPFAAKANRGVSTELAIQNLNPNPGFTDFVILIYDQNRLIDFVCEKLNEKQVEYIDFSEWGYIPDGFLGSLVISSVHSDQKGGAALGAVGVERIGRILSQPDIPGDESKAFEAFPLFNRFRIEEGPDGQPPRCPGQP